MRPVVKRIGERRAIALGFGFGTLGMLVYGVAPSAALFIVGIPVMALWGFAGPSIQSLMTRLVSPSEQGQLQGANASLAAVASVIGPSLFTQVFAHFIADGSKATSGAPFVLAAALLAAALAVTWIATAKGAVKAPAK